ncbi:MAG: hypothetical protein ACOC03_04335, partial [Desulfosalsimonas sp.]
IAQALILKFFRRHLNSDFLQVHQIINRSKNGKYIQTKIQEVKLCQAKRQCRMAPLSECLQKKVLKTQGVCQDSEVSADPIGIFAPGKGRILFNEGHACRRRGAEPG